MSKVVSLLSRLPKNKCSGIDARRLKRQSPEHNIQVTFFEWLRIMHPYLRSLAFAIPNGGSRNPKEAANLKREGVTAGVPDVFIAYPSWGHHGLFIEFKAGKNKPTKLQQAFMARLIEQQYKVVVCYSIDEAQTVISDYLKR